MQKVTITPVVSLLLWHNHSQLATTECYNQSKNNVTRQSLKRLSKNKTCYHCSHKRTKYLFSSWVGVWLAGEVLVISASLSSAWVMVARLCTPTAKLFPVPVSFFNIGGGPPTDDRPTAADCGDTYHAAKWYNIRHDIMKKTDHKNIETSKSRPRRQSHWGEGPVQQVSFYIYMYIQYWILLAMNLYTKKAYFSCLPQHLTVLPCKMAYYINWDFCISALWPNVLHDDNNRQQQEWNPIIETWLHLLSTKNKTLICP